MQKSPALRYIAFHKPYGVVCQFSPDGDSRTLAEFDLPAGIYAAGRLDKDSEGLLLLTSDGAFINRLTDPKFEKEKTYWVQVERIPSEEALEKLKRGLKIQDYLTKPCQARRLDNVDIPPRDPPIRVRKTVPDCWIEMTITEGKNRQVRHMTAAIGHPTLRLVRMAIGKLRLEGLRPGEWREVSPQDIL